MGLYRTAVRAAMGRFCELYIDRGSHFCQSGPSGEVAEEQNGHVSQALRALGIHQILARSPQARGRSERAFGTIQGRLPQELRHHGIADYAAANRYLEQHFIPDFNRRFTIKPAQPGKRLRQTGRRRTGAGAVEQTRAGSAQRQHPHLQKPDSAVAFHPPAHPFRALPRDRPSVFQRYSGYQLSGPSAGSLRCG
jgi:hypothetical protein